MFNDSAYKETIKVLKNENDWLRSQNVELQVFIRELTINSTASLVDYGRPVVSPLSRPSKEVSDGLVRIFDEVSGDHLDVPKDWINDGP